MKPMKNNLTFCPLCGADYEYGNEQASRIYEHSTCEDYAQWMEEN